MSKFNHLESISTLKKILELQSFSDAAKKLGLTQAAISIRIKELESFMGETVISRDRPYQATNVGHKLVLYLESIEEVYSRIFERDGNKQNTVTISINQDSLDTWAAKLISNKDFMQHYLEFKVRDQSLTHQLLRNGEAHISVSSHYLEDINTKSELIGCMEYSVCVSKKVFLKYFQDKNIAEILKAFPYILFDKQDLLHAQYLKEQLNIKTLQSSRVYYFPSNSLIKVGLIKSEVCAVVPLQLVDDEIKRGTIIELFPQKRLQVELYVNYHKFAPQYIRQIVRRIVDSKLV